MSMWKNLFKRQNVKTAFISGLLVAIPLGITIFTFQFIFGFIDNIFGRYIREILPFYIPGIGFIATFLIIFLLGAFVNHWLGKKMFERIEKRLSKLPILGSLYTVSRQIVEIIGSSRRKEFQKVIFLQYPAEGIWTIGFVTGQSLAADGMRMYNVFVPTTPNPTSGYMVFIPWEDAVDTRLTIEEGLKMLISGGMVSPPRMPFPGKKRLTVHQDLNPDRGTDSLKTPDEKGDES
ncbi:DUF502 domain-containing protein [Fidelibacter multiformis]|uniref:DUF502 domain-containing protein n=1 Tax=Fidelibacter multiformis TaxID=3377529 RepID=UPI0037DDC830